MRKQNKKSTLTLTEDRGYDNDRYVDLLWSAWLDSVLQAISKAGENSKVETTEFSAALQRTYEDYEEKHRKLMEDLDTAIYHEKSSELRFELSSIKEKLEYPNFTNGEFRKFLEENKEALEVVKDQISAFSNACYARQSAYYRREEAKKNAEKESKRILKENIKNSGDVKQFYYLIKKADVSDVREMLSQLDTALTYKSYFPRCAYYSDKTNEILDFHGALRLVRDNILFNLTEEQCKKIELNFTYKRIIESEFIKKIGECQDLTQIIDLYNQYSDHPVMTQRRHQYYDFFFNSGYTCLKKNFIKALQERARYLITKDNDQHGLSQTNFIDLKDKIFSNIHLKNGVGKENHNWFEQTFQISSVMPPPVAIHSAMTVAEYLNELKKANEVRSEVEERMEKLGKEEGECNILIAANF